VFDFVFLFKEQFGPEREMLYAEERTNVGYVGAIDLSPVITELGRLEIDEHEHYPVVLLSSAAND
jgi:hypothetical protein